MKFKKYILSSGLFLTLVASVTSCSKVLDVNLEFQKDGSQIFNNINDYQFALTGAYALLRQTGYYGNGSATTGAWSTLPDMMGEDLLQTSEDLANHSPLTNYFFNAADADIDTFWLTAYRVIAQANIVLRNIEQFNATSPKAVNRIKGQALAIRAMAHFDLLRYWGVSFERNSTAFGVPYVTVVDQSAKPTRPTVKENYDAIFADLTTAETLLDDVDVTINTTATARTLIDRTVVKAMLARVNLYAKQYLAAETYANEVITAIPLAAPSDFRNVWKDSYFASEVIWSVSFSVLSEGTPAGQLISSSTNKNFYKPSATIIGLFTDKVNDVRYSTYIASRLANPPASPVDADPNSTIARKVVNKYVGKGSNTDNVVNWKVFRTGEMYLIRAEARAMQTGKQAAALADLNALRAFRYTANYVPLTGLVDQPLLDAIFIERRKELFAEGHRWFDLKRTTRTFARTDFAGAQALVASSPVPTPTSRVWAFPLPTREITGNPNIAPQQSPGWN